MIQGMIRLLCVVLVLFTMACGTGCGGSAENTPAGETAPTNRGAASITAEETGEQRWQVRIADADGVAMRVNIEWREHEEAYATVGIGSGLSGLKLGPTGATFADGAWLRDAGRSPRGTVHTLNPTELIKDPITVDQFVVLQEMSGDLILGRYEDGYVTDVWYFGALVPQLKRRHDRGESVCDALEALCCRDGLPLPEGHEPPDKPPPWPIPTACLAAADLCIEDADRIAACCQCIERACLDIDITLPTELSNLGASSCVLAFRMCHQLEQGGMEQEMIDRARILGTIADRIWSE